jgi:hypothetical protein
MPQVEELCSSPLSSLMTFEIRMTIGILHVHGVLQNALDRIKLARGI